ncbi:heparan-alpha-glucosaminide N-acetyltransferase domain-containing protein [Pseudonocardia sp. WMMC193]|uniref:heparan-alpha-glucosaminide N-acetyltransferase domain-containing protein n=1 Tax=Pseudonocardia sp. WMMC193 TaxID=2911965 RepID=UPI001F228A78|nr:heparan-alpha-glucosaminide N-acetyltransferase domain-containing protein [Pseudonocardia sp. WMMC193]MCF7548865.1 heparan-alpha-glucosaminide N-acetyltransferase domain-containing protein [Pseudonocardia sp. WMMC193]
MSGGPAAGIDAAATAAPRLAGVDAARGLALLGMMATHLLPLHTAAGETVVGAVAAGRASALFAVLLGVGISLGARAPRGAAAAGLVVRAVLTGVVGLVLVGFDPPVAVILTYYALLILVAIPLLWAPTPLLAAGAVVAAVGTPVLSALLRVGLPAGPGAQVGFAALGDPGPALVTLLVTGYYPVLTWTTYLLAGMAVGRLDLRSVRTAWWLLGGGAALSAAATVASHLLLTPEGLAAIGGARQLDVQRYGTLPTDTWWWFATELPHTGTPLDLLQTTGAALAVLGLCLLVARALPWLVVPFAVIGAVPLTLYALHVVSLALVGGEGPAVYLEHVAWCLAIGTAVRLLRVRGPLEAMVSGAARATRRAMIAS